MTLSVGDIMGIKDKGEKEAARAADRVEPCPEAGEEESSIYLLGLTFDEAMPKLEKFLDGHMLTDTQTVVVIHGKGILKEKITAYLAGSPYVKSFSAAPPDKGGEGASVVLMKD